MKIFEIMRVNRQKDLMDRRTAEGWEDMFGGHFRCNNSLLTSLEGAPTKVRGNFWCNDNQLTSLEGAPTYVGGNFQCQNNQLTSLQGAPTEVGGNFWCGNNQLTSLQGAPTEIKGEFWCSNNQLTSLEGAPTKVGGNFWCENNPMQSLVGIGAHFKNGYINGRLSIPSSVESHILGVLLIPKLHSIEPNIANYKLEAAVKIIHKHLSGDKDILECQEELRSAGLREYGKL